MNVETFSYLNPDDKPTWSLLSCLTDANLRAQLSQRQSEGGEVRSNSCSKLLIVT